jgi:hypothetical protein
MMKNLGFLFTLALGLSACMSTAPPVVPTHGEAFVGLALQFET